MDLTLVFQALPRQSTLTPVAQGFYVEQPGRSSYFLEDEILQRIDSRLPEGIRLLQAVREFEKVPTSAIVVMLHLWLTTMHIENASGEKVGLSRVGNITELQALVRIQCDGYIYTEEVSPKSGDTMLIPTDTNTSLTLIKKSWLDAKYPKWQERLQVARDINVDCTAAMHHMLSHGTSDASVAVPVDFAL